MAERNGRRSRIWMIVVAILATLVAVIVAMNFVTPEKRLEHKLAHRYALSDTQFRREIGVMLGPSITHGNRITALQNGDEIFPSMLQAIAGAQRTITFETYIYWSGSIGEQFTRALTERAANGVKIHLLVDWAGSHKMDEAMVDRMRKAGIEIHHYRPLRWYHLGRLNNRTHRKLLVVDGRIGFTGGVGIADLWLGHAQDPQHWRDSHFRVEGPVVAQMQAAFNDNWIKTTGEVLNGDAYFPALPPAGEVDAQLFISSPAGGSESMHLMYLMSIEAATTSIDLAASYFVPDELAVGALLAARQRGVRVRILLPGPHTDSDATRIASKAEWEPLLGAGVEISEYQPTMLHTKMLVIDDEMVSVGSTNFDNRSFRLNDEASLNIYDGEFAQTMTRVFEADLKLSRRYTLEDWRNRPMKERLAEKFLRPIKSQL